ncbi:hypothetical protein AB0N38_28795 [Micromonospora aurantiaca]|jgi:hypothetical protein
MHAEQGQQRQVKVVAGVDRAVELGQPQLDAVEFEQRREVAELVAVEGSFELSYYHRVESAVGVGEGCQQSRGLRAARPGQLPGMAYVEEFGHDDASAVDHVFGEVALPARRRQLVLEFPGRHPAVEREADAQGMWCYRAPLPWAASPVRLPYPPAEQVGGVELRRVLHQDLPH